MEEGRDRPGAQVSEPGWYPDPRGQARQRWWDGTAWTDQVQGSAAGQPAAAAPPQGSKTSGLAIASLVFGILGLFLGVGWLLAIVFGFVARSQIKRSGGAVGGRGLATAGVVLGFLWLALILVIATLAATGVLDDEPNTERFRGGEREEVVAVIDRFEEASDNDRFREICRELFSPALTRTIEAGANKSCEAVSEDEDTGFQRHITVERVKVSGTTASVDGREGTESFSMGLVEKGGRWRITSIK